MSADSIDTAAGGAPFGVGAELRRARERRGLSIEQLARITKINPAILRHLEANRLDRLPQPVFVRGFLRVYAREVGLDPEATVYRWFAQFEPAAQQAEPNDLAAAATRVPWRPAGWDDVSLKEVLVRFQHLGLAAAVIVILLVVHALSGPDTPDAGRASAAPDPSAAPPVSGEGETATLGTSDSLAVAADGQLLRITLRPTAECWLSATVDGERVLYRLLQPGEEQTLDVRNDAVLRVGDAAALSYTVNGAPGRVLGGPGEVVTVHLTPDTAAGFVASTGERRLS